LANWWQDGPIKLLQFGSHFEALFFVLIFITQLAIGFSVVSAAVLLVAYLFFIREMRKTPVAMVSVTFLLFALVGLQLLHWQHLTDGNDLFVSRLYVFLLLTVPPMFFFFSRELLMPESKVSPL